ncbi:uncharacterized protein BDR25DRAFT_274708 [Lindgomyces ingoldianus]|uniref:Uncharacterized protein n=1 Tax=Lindgomyces ingoldianus TaxID=673940 RepID=A0ACB6RGS2_9PLEO|nr:uncharacterized protein BDR25DRAFT_274708 [Lindgomyces ingoldianus]KAF2477517.1 hypothetical protein BDR25DRAFT_274708 [Lindgomyces ingoldianus]
MSPYSHSPSRVLATTLSSLTLITHTLVVFFALHIHNSVLPLDYHFFPSSGFELYNVLAAGGSALGVFGALRMDTLLVSAYTTVHATTLLISTLALFDLVLPFETTAAIPIFPSMRLGFVDMCSEHDGFGWDAQWVDQCRMSFAVMKAVAVGVGLVLVGIQWWAVGKVWRWGRGLRREEPKRREMGRDVEKVVVDEKVDMLETGEDVGDGLWSRV